MQSPAGWHDGSQKGLKPKQRAVMAFSTHTRTHTKGKYWRRAAGQRKRPRSPADQSRSGGVATGSASLLLFFRLGSDGASSCRHVAGAGQHPEVAAGGRGERRSRHRAPLSRGGPSRERCAEVCGGVAVESGGGLSSVRLRGAAGSLRLRWAGGGLRGCARRARPGLRPRGGVCEGGRGEGRAALAVWLSPWGRGLVAERTRGCWCGSVLGGAVLRLQVLGVVFLLHVKLRFVQDSLRFVQYHDMYLCPTSLLCFLPHGSALPARSPHWRTSACTFNAAFLCQRGKKQTETLRYEVTDFSKYFCNPSRPPGCQQAARRQGTRWGTVTGRSWAQPRAGGSLPQAVRGPLESPVLRSRWTPDRLGAGQGTGQSSPVLSAPLSCPLTDSPQISFVVQKRGSGRRSAGAVCSEHVYWQKVVVFCVSVRVVVRLWPRLALP